MSWKVERIYTSHTIRFRLLHNERTVVETGLIPREKEERWKRIEVEIEEIAKDLEFVESMARDPFELGRQTATEDSERWQET